MHAIQFFNRTNTYHCLHMQSFYEVHYKVLTFTYEKFYIRRNEFHDTHGHKNGLKDTLQDFRE